jgi:4-hydroxybenzoate polyprenyltransferase
MNTPFHLQIWHYFLHLRLHYQFFILSGGYLLASLFADSIDQGTYWMQFLNVHILLFGGATAYNSYWDKDEGPIGGLKNPPKMTRWMWAVSLLMQFAGLVWAFSIGFSYSVIYAVSMLLFWLYSTPHARWKGHPYLSLFVIGVSTGTNSFLMGYIGATGSGLELQQGILAFGVACVLLSLYPVSQIFQYEEDGKRGDRTFAMVHRLTGVRRFYAVLFPLGVIIISWMLYAKVAWMGLFFFFAGVPAYLFIVFILWRLEGKESEYGMVMKIKFLASLSFVIFILSALLVKTIV